jgi:predicted RND superfamily exporter protein
MHGILRAITERAGLVLLLTAALTVLALSQLVDFRTGAVRLKLDSSLDRLMPDEDDDRLFYESARKLFGSDETIVVALAADPLFTAENLGRIQRMTKRFSEIDGVAEVVSMATAMNVRSVDGDLQIEPFLSKIPTDPAALAAIRDQTLANPMYAGNLVSHKGTTTALVLHIANMPQSEFLKRGIEEKIRAIAEEERGETTVWITGSAIVKNAIARILLGDLSRIVPLALALAMLVALLSYRSFRGVLVPLMCVVLGIVWTLAVMVWLGRPLNIVTVIVPPLLITVGYAYAMHLMSEYYTIARAGETKPSEVAAHALSEEVVPILVCGFTTAVGFGSVAVSPLSSVREFAFFSVLGTVLTVMITLTAAPALLSLLSVPKVVPVEKRGTRLDRMAARLAEFDVRNHRAIFAVAALVFCISLYGMTRIEVNSEIVGSFSRSEPVRRDAEAVNANLDGANPLYIVISTGTADAFKDPANLRQLVLLEDWLKQQPEVGSVTSLADYLMVVNRAFHDDDPKQLAIPESRALAGQLLTFADNKDVRSLVDARYKTANILVRSTAANSKQVKALADRIDARLAELPERMHGRVTGSTVLISRAVDDMVSGTAQSLALGFGLIYLVLVALFASFRVGLVALAPNALPVSIYFGVMGLAGIGLNSTTGLVADIVLGIAIDDTIHYMHRFNVEAKRLGDEKKGTIAALSALGRPVTLTGIALCLGFLVMGLSRLSSQREFGLLASFTLACGWVCEMTLTPALCSVTKIVTLWDVVTLDLGHAPQRSIRLFRGLTDRQSRIAALMMGVRKFARGTRVFHAGEQGEDMHVVIDGELAARITTKDGVRDLSTMKRGETVGEVALFTGVRTVDVDAVTDVRTVRLTRADMDQLRKRYPRIGSRILWNLSEILADRVAENTRRIS